MRLLGLSSNILHLTSSAITCSNLWATIFWTVLEIFVNLGFKLFQDFSQKNCIVRAHKSHQVTHSMWNEMQYIWWWIDQGHLEDKYPLNTPHYNARVSLIRLLNQTTNLLTTYPASLVVGMLVYCSCKVQTVVCFSELRSHHPVLTDFCWLPEPLWVEYRQLLIYLLSLIQPGPPSSAYLNMSNIGKFT